MNLRKDAFVAVCMAGVVLIALGLIGNLSRSDSSSASSLKAAAQDQELYEIFSNADRAMMTGDVESADKILGQARTSALKIYDSRPLKGSLDYYRLARVLSTSSDPSELALAHNLSMSAYAGGIDYAKRLVLETQDRLLLSLGESQRYGTQSAWHGKRLASFGKVSPQVPPSLQDSLNEPTAARPLVLAD